MNLILLVVLFFLVLTLFGWLLFYLEDKPTKQSESYLTWYHKTNNGQSEPINQTPTHLDHL